MRKIAEYQGKSIWWWITYMLNNVLSKSNEIIVIKIFDNARVLIDTNDKSPDNITFKNPVV